MRTKRKAGLVVAVCLVLIISGCKKLSCGADCSDLFVGYCESKLDCINGMCVNRLCPDAPLCECPLASEPELEDSQDIEEEEPELEISQDTEEEESDPAEPQDPDPSESEPQPDSNTPADSLSEFTLHAGLPQDIIDQLISGFYQDQVGDQFHYDINVETTNQFPEIEIIGYGGYLFNLTDLVIENWFAPGGAFSCDQMHTYCSDLGAEYEADYWINTVLVLTQTEAPPLDYASAANLQMFGAFLNEGGEVFQAEEPYLYNLYNGTNLWFQIFPDLTTGELKPHESFWTGEGQEYYDPYFRITIWNDLMAFWIPGEGFSQEEGYRVVSWGINGEGSQAHEYSSDTNGANPTEGLEALLFMEIPSVTLVK